jgi:hypothetical protein
MHHLKPLAQINPLGQVSRRHAIAAALAGVCTPLVGGCSCRSTYGRSGDFVAVGIPTDRMTQAAAAQKGQMWCWAACIQMVLSLKGVSISQEEIVKQTFGSAVDLPGGFDDIQRRLTGRFNTGWGTSQLLIASLLAGPPQPGLLYSYLRSRTPLILALTYPGTSIGHAVVLTGAVFQVMDEGLGIELANVRDPDPSFANTSGKREITPEEYNSIACHFVLDVVKAA